MVRRKTYDRVPELGNHPGAESSGPRMARKIDRDAPPSGWDADVWDLALFWEQLRDKYEHPGPGRPVIYSELESAVTRHGVREMKLRNETDSDPAWVRLLKLMIEYFWDEDMDPGRPAAALNDFVAAGEFTGLRDMVLSREHHRRVVKRMDDEREARREAGTISPQRQAYLDRKAERVPAAFRANPDVQAVVRALLSDEALQVQEDVRRRLRAGEKLGDIIRERREGETQ